jgi:hypothetical protein
MTTARMSPVQWENWDAPKGMAYMLNPNDMYYEPATGGNVDAPEQQHYPPLRTNEQNEVLGIFMQLLAGPTGDGGNKRAAGTKVSWKIDPSHKAKFLGHLVRWLCGEKFDKDSGWHPLQHVAWRCLAIAYQEMAAAGDLPEEPS